MNKMCTFFIAVVLMFVADLLHFEAPPNTFQDTTGINAAEALAEFNNDVATPNSGPGFMPELNSLIGNDTSSASPDRALDPVTILLLGSGLIGLAGLGRKKI